MATALSNSQPDVVAIPGWSEKGALAALRWCLGKAVPVVLMSETTAGDEPRVWWKEFVKRRVVRLCAAALVGGERHKSYLMALGMPGERIFTGYDAVDNDFFADARRVIGDRLLVIREKLRLPQKYFLASARFIPKKNLDLLIRAYAEYRQRSEVGSERTEAGASLDLSHVTSPSSPPWSLVILGDGPLKSDLRRLISDLSLGESVLLPGFKQYDELPNYYAGAGAFVHPSRVEQWGLVVNEAMASGLPLIVSNRCGCAPELVQEGVNGFTFDPRNERQLSELLLEMASLSNDRRSKVGQASREMVQQFGPEGFALGLKAAASSALSRARRSASLIDRVILDRVLSR
jgi:glycosyltransferase involved in cell wall biosynthesis